MAERKGFVSNAKAFDNYSKGWSLAVKEFIPLLLTIIMTAVISAVAGILPLLSLLITIPLRIGADWVFLKAARKQRFESTDFLDVFKENYVQALLAGVLTAILIIIGLLFLIIPGIIIAARLAFVNYLVMDRKMKAVEAIKESWRMTKGRLWTMLGMSFIALFAFIGGLLALVVGALFSITWISASFAVYYNSIPTRLQNPPKKSVKRRKNN